METQSVSKKAKLILPISLIFNIILVITVVIQYRRITEHRNDLKEVTFSEISIKNNKSESKTVDTSSIITGLPDSNSDKEIIKNLKSQIADMQDWQDYLEEKLAKYEMTSEEKFYNSIYNASKSKNSSRFEPFFEENSISPAQKTEFIELLAQSRLELVDLDKESMNSEDYQKEEEKIKSKYDDLISNLLSEENYTAYQDFLKSEEDRPLISGFKEVVFTGHNQLNKQQEKDLLAAMSSKRLEIEETLGISKLDIEKAQNPEYFAKWLNDQNKIMNGYLEVSKDILTDSQMEKFKKYIDIQIASGERWEKETYQVLEITNSDTEKAEI
ncbi:MAG: hypothetical protein JXK07_10210 [Spirochaetes bacterium]|nr:hypothetical protein [Spirochaetota bacterium]